MNVPVIVRDRPFTTEFRQFFAAEGMTIAEMVETAPDLPTLFRERGQVILERGFDEAVVARGAWHLVRPKVDGDSPIIVRLEMPLRGTGGGGSGSGKSTFATIATIAVFAAATLATAGVFGGAGTLVLGTLTAAQVGGAAIALGGSLAIAMLTPPPSFDAVSGPKGPDTSGRLNVASLSGNVLSPGSPVPRCIGPMKFFPQLACQPLVEPIGDEEVVEGVYIASGPHAWDDIRNEGALLSENPKIQFETRDGFPGDAPLDLVRRQGYTRQRGTELSEHKVDKTNSDRLADQGSPESSLPVWFAARGRQSPDEIWLAHLFPQGLFKTTSSSTAVLVPLRFRFRLVGSLTWINAPEIMVKSKRARPFQISVRFLFEEAPTTTPTPAADNAPVYAFKEVPVAPDGRGGWSADGYFSAGAGNDVLSAATVATTKVRNVHLYNDRVNIYLDPATFPKGRYEIEQIRGYAFDSSNFVPGTYIFNATAVRDFFGYYLSGSFYIVAQDQDNYSAKVIFNRDSYIWNEPVIARPGVFAVLAVKGTGVNVNRISAIASGYTKDWNGTAWETVTTSENAAPHAVELLTGIMNAKRLPMRLLDNDDFLDLRQHCIDNDLKINTVLEGRKALDALDVILGAVYARRRQSEKWGVLIDRDTSAEGVNQTWSHRNSRGLRWSKAFNHTSKAFRLRFSDRDNDYEEDQIIVRDPGVEEDDGLYEEIRLEIVDRDKAIRRAEYDLMQARLRLTFYTLTTNLQHIRSRKGDLNGVQSDMLRQFAGSAYIKQVIKSGSNVTGLVLDGSVPTPSEAAFTNIAAAFSDYGDAFAAPRAGIAIRLRDGSIYVREIEGGANEVKTVTFPVPFADFGNIVLGAVSKPILDRGCHVTTGPLGFEYSRKKVFEIVPKADGTAEMTFVDEAPELFAA